MTPTVTARGCNRILLGKTFYKGVVLPTTMYNTEIMYFTDIEIEKIQKEENKLYRYLLNAPVHTSIAAIRGKIGVSCQKTRMIKSKIHYLEHLLTNNQLLKELFLDDYNKNSKWIKQIKNYLKTTNLNIYKIEHQTLKQIDNKINNYDNIKWKNELQIKSSMNFYRKYKIQIRDEQQIYDNNQESAILFRARTNTLKLQDWKGHTNNSSICRLCNKETENTQHFILHCTALEKTRRKITSLKKKQKETD